LDYWLTEPIRNGANSGPGYYSLLFLLALLHLLAFSTPNFSYKGKLIYAAVTYTFLLLMYASSNLPYSALSGVLTGDMGERNSISSYRFVAVMFAQFFVQVFMLPIIEYAGHGDKAVGLKQ
jgi:GPH family glycoside/pentoside/hexuronide:cation symporter